MITCLLQKCPYLEVSEPGDDHHLGAISTRGAKAINKKLKASNQAAREKMMVIMIKFTSLKFCAWGRRVARLHSVLYVHVISCLSEMYTKLGEECLQMVLLFGKASFL